MNRLTLSVLIICGTLLLPLLVCLLTYILKEIKFWYIRTFKTRNCIMPEDATEFSWSDDDIPQWVKDTDKSKWEFTIMDEENK